MYQRPDYIDQDKLLEALQDLGLNPTHIHHMVITPREVQLTEYLLDETSTPRIDPAYGEVPLCENTIPISTPEEWAARHRREAADLAHLTGY